MNAAKREGLQAPAQPGLFDRILVGVDGGEASLAAVRQAARLVADGGELELVAAVHLAESSAVGPAAPLTADRLRRQSELALEQALEAAGRPAARRLVDGPALKALLHELDRTRAGLVAVGTHGHRRLTEILIGGVAGGLLHDAPSSVLIAREQAWPVPFPRSIAAGTDGSVEGDAAVEVARELAHRFGVPVKVLCAAGGKPVDVRRADVELVPGSPVETLVAAGAEADLLVVGSRGLHGLRALGSVSERVAHSAPCSVLVVRPRPG